MAEFAHLQEAEQMPFLMVLGAWRGGGGVLGGEVKDDPRVRGTEQAGQVRNWVEACVPPGTGTRNQLRAPELLLESQLCPGPVPLPLLPVSSFVKRG